MEGMLDFKPLEIFLIKHLSIQNFQKLIFYYLYILDVTNACFKINSLASLIGRPGCRPINEFFTLNNWWVTDFIEIWVVDLYAKLIICPCCIYYVFKLFEKNLKTSFYKIVLIVSTVCSPSLFYWNFEEKSLRTFTVQCNFKGKIN